MKTKLVRQKVASNEDRRRDWNLQVDRELLEQEVRRLFGTPVKEQPVVDLELGIWKLPD